MRGQLVRSLREASRPPQLSRAEVIELCQCASSEAPLSLAQACTLLEIDPPKEPDAYRAVLSASRRMKNELFEGRAFALVPVYVSSICQEHCVYCNYRVGNKDREITRVRLSDAELREELQFLADRGFRVLELVYATDPAVGIPDIIRHLEIAQDVLNRVGGGSVGLNARPFSRLDYADLKRAGLDFAVVWQETYDEGVYAQVHPGGTEKTDFRYRLEAPQRMLEAGVRHIGLGVLSGLADWRRDWARLMRHIEFLQRQSSTSLEAMIIGLPRLKPAAGALMQTSRFVPSDDELQLAIASLNLFLPTALPFVNTRERWPICLQLAFGGGTLFTLNCRTIPGGYAHHRVGYQFPTFDFSVELYADDLRAHGIEPVFNWTFDSVRQHLRVERIPR